MHNTNIYSTESQIQFFFDMKWPNGFKCPSCGHIHFSYYSSKDIYKCTRCHHQTTLKSGTIKERWDWLYICSFKFPQNQVCNDDAEYELQFNG